MTEENINKTLEKAKADNIKLVQLQFTDIHGIIKSVTIPIEKLKENLKREHGLMAALLKALLIFSILKKRLF
ncbi:MAG: hypothetical protein QF362_03605 [Candidatus Woesearchaeota archaeon]|jgi:glutamine synthetase|nr:hypothetical protein [Candidatus Woesearchaeota archaeon]MDP7506502.1 hypothetical protein [Candidatus Woesearchaeota archaeon]MDP7610603.1 hypothetical protein [Candidatus Woesearchaeota archaeon]|tara:strand:- start:200 stop:415 length:216 start_codon:yes stop_codon:yes gene_type:complete